MPLITGTWKINVNGTAGDLVINSSADGTINGSVIDVPLSGYWNEASQTIFFETLVPPVAGLSGFIPVLVGSTNSIGTFVGYLFSTPPVPVPGSDIKWTLCGYVMTPPTFGFPAAMSNSRRTTFGWFAEITEVI